MRRRRLALAGLAGLALGLAAAGRAAIDRSIAADLRRFEYEGEGEPFAADAGRLRAIEAAGRTIGPLHRVKEGPGPGDWLRKRPEAGQRFASYRRGRPNRPTSARTTLDLQAWGDFDATQAEHFGLTGEMLGEFFGVPVKVLGPHGLQAVPAEARAWDPDLGGLRIDAPYVVEELHRAIPGDAAAVLAVTTADLTRGVSGSWAFGQASLTGRVGVCSLYRHGDAREAFAPRLKRTLKTAVHETGHMMGIAHCADFECAMNGSSSRREADGQPAWFCPEDEMKVWLACGADPAGRYARLAAFAESHGLEAEGRFWRRSGEVLARPAVGGRGR